MQVELTIKNYRCFPDSRPLRFEIRDGFVAFVGINNSGKSSALKFFYEFRTLFQQLSNPDSLVNFFHSGQMGFGFPSSVKDPEEVFSDLNRRNLLIEFKFSPQSSLVKPIRLALEVQRGAAFASGLELQTGRELFRPQEAQFEKTQYYTLRRLSDSAEIDLSEFNEVMRALWETMYIGAFRNAINVGAADNYYDISVGQAFVAAWREYKSGHTRRFNVLAKQITDDISSIFGIGLEINPSPDSVTLKLLVDGKSYKLDDVGSGLAQFIVVLASVAMRNPSFLLLDEPELNLHPSLQVSFLTTLASYAKSGVIFSTHSIGLARAIADHVYAARRIKHGESDVRLLENVPRYAEFLGELSFNGYQELGFDGILLVEGSTEVRTIQQFLRRMKIDHQLVLLPLGGSGMINGSRQEELLEIKRISQNVSALIDSEKSSSLAQLDQSRAEFVSACKQAGIKCHVLERRALENYFPEVAIKAEKGDKYRALGDFEELKSAQPCWAKSENWRIARRTELFDLEGTDLLLFLNELKTSIAQRSVSHS